MVKYKYQINNIYDQIKFYKRPNKINKSLINFNNKKI